MSTIFLFGGLAAACAEAENAGYFPKLLRVETENHEELRRRLVGRGTDAPEVIERRVAKAEFELTKAPEFDHIVVNDSLDEAIRETTAIIDQFIARQP